MKNVNHETISDIVAWIRRHSSVYGYDLADRIEAAAKRGDDVWRAAFAKVTFVVSRQHAKRNLGEQGSRAVAEIMSVCRFPDGALDEYERAFAENAHLRAALKPVLECKVLSAMTAEIEPGESDYCSNIILKAQRIYNEGGERR